MYVPEDGFICSGEDRGQLFNQMGSVARILQLVDDADDNIVVDTIRIDPGTAFRTWRWWRRIAVHGSSTAFGPLGEGDILGG